MKLFITDFDGTLGTTNKEITPATREALDRWCAAGNVFVLSSGRALMNIREIAEQLGLNYPGMLIVGYNGSEVYDCGKGELIFHRGIPMKLIPEIFRLAKETGLYIQTYNDTHILCEHLSDELTYYNTWVHLPHLVADNIMDLVEKDPCKCLAITQHHTELLPVLRDKILAAFPGVVNAYQSSEYLLEIVTADVDKGTSLQFLCDYFNIPVSDTIAAGDAPNDIPMLKAAGLGIVMKNGAEIYPEMREAGQQPGCVITEEDNDHDGLVPYLQV